MRHYFTNDDSDKREYMFETGVMGLKIALKTSDGVFSKSAVDEGTGHLLKAVLPLLDDGEKRLADLGCGYGVIGIAAAMAKPKYNIVMTDINEKAVELANYNTERNGAEHRAVAYVSDGIISFLSEGKAFDYVLTNPPFRAGKQTVIKFFIEAYRVLVPGGKFYAVLRKQQGAESYIRALIEIFGNCVIIFKKKGYVVTEAMKKDGFFSEV